jgi:hypothetical protein
VALVRRSRKLSMSTAHRTRESVSFRNYWNGSTWPCAFALMAIVVDGIQARPAVDPLAQGDGNPS